MRLTPGWRQPESNRRDINMPTNSEIEFELNGTYDTFTSSVRTNNDNAQVEFVVLGDGKELWKSRPQMKADGSRSTRVDVSNVKRLTLRVRRVDEGGRVFADWVDTKLLK
jgi:hypothetical protein